MYQTMGVDVHNTVAGQSLLRQALDSSAVIILSLVAVFVSLELLAWAYTCGAWSRSTSGAETTNPSTGSTSQRRKSNQSERHKVLYHQLQNLEEFPGIIPEARDTLLEWFAEALESASSYVHTASSILCITNYSEDGLAEFVRLEHDRVAERWHDYIQRRELGQSRERLKTREDAKQWLKGISPLKYVDGAWLGHINRVTTPFALRHITKNAWQILSEEYGDGDIEKHHVYVYRTLMRNIDAELPQPDQREFIDPKHWQESQDSSIWKSATAQLLISLFPGEFLPEILGFNLHFECVTEETLIASRELRELGLDPYYFLLHVSIDNMDSGHTAIALKVVSDYMKYIRAEKDDDEVQRAWRGIQTGYTLSKTLGCSDDLATSRHDLGVSSSLPRRKQETAVERVFMSKALASRRIHCGLKTKIGHRTLDEWLDPEAMTSPIWRAELLYSLGRTKQLVSRGQYEKSKLIKELSWKGKMFGAFTESEVQIVKSWIDDLPPLDQIYWDFVGKSCKPSHDGCEVRDMVKKYPVVLPYIATKLDGEQQQEVGGPTATILMPAERLCIRQLIPLWFTHLALLESFISIPTRTATPFGCSILRLVRAQSGFGIETPGVAGTDESRRTPLGLIELGLELMRRRGLKEPGTLLEVLEMWPSGFAREMLQLSMHPTRQIPTLLGLTYAFVDLHTFVASTDLLSTTSRDKLRLLAQRETQMLKLCLRGIQDRGHSYTLEFQAAYRRGRAEIASCFEVES